MVSLGPFKNKHVRVEVDDILISVVELTGLELIKNGQIEAKYGYIESCDGSYHSARRHSVGPNFARFSVRRWFKTGTGQAKFNTLNNSGVEFTIKQYINKDINVEGLYRGIHLNKCKIYRYRLVTGTPNDIIAEEIIGEALSWTVCPIGEQITNGDFETGDLTGYTETFCAIENSIVHSGGYSCYIGSSGGCSPTFGWLEQDIETLKGSPVPVECIESFTAWICAASGLQGNAGRILITYSDTTTTLILVPQPAFNTWEQVDILTSLIAGKSISKIKFYKTGIYGYDYVDDVSLIC